MEFEWDPANVSHLQAHGVEPEAVVEAFYGVSVVLKEQLVSGEDRTVFLGRTGVGSILVVVYTRRSGKIRVVTAFPAKRKLRRLYAEVTDA